jgi:hypothetical protein
MNIDAVLEKESKFVNRMLWVAGGVASAGFIALVYVTYIA